MPLILSEGDITRMKVDAIVNAANHTLLGGGGVDGAIHRAAGRGLLEECRTLGGCATGDAKITGGYNLPAAHVIHTVGPVWHGGTHGEQHLLESCYRRSLAVAAENNLSTVAFSLISSGVYGYPIRDAREVAETVIWDFLRDHTGMTVFLVFYTRDFFRMTDKEEFALMRLERRYPLSSDREERPWEGGTKIMDLLREKRMEEKEYLWKANGHAPGAVATRSGALAAALALGLSLEETKALVPGFPEKTLSDSVIAEKITAGSDLRAVNDALFFCCRPTL